MTTRPAASPRRRRLWAIALLLAVPAAGAWRYYLVDHVADAASIGKREAGSIRNGGDAASIGKHGGMAPIPAGRFLMGNDFAGQIDQRPMHEVEVDRFWLDRHEVTNRQFARFIADTGYVTTAERRGKSLVFEPTTASWQTVAGACWRQPRGPESSITGRDDQPVVQVSWHDAAAYARWAGKRLPTEAEWEYAARGGLFDADYPWGRAEKPNDVYQANTWQGWFPDEDLGSDSHRHLARVGSFPPNRFGLVDMAGNVWEWCADWYADDAYRRGLMRNPTGPAHGEERVRRGGSWLCAPNWSDGLKVSTRNSALPDAATNHLSFRCARDGRPEHTSRLKLGNSTRRR